MVIFPGNYLVATFEPRMTFQNVWRILRDSEPNPAADTATREHLAPGDRSHEAILPAWHDTAGCLDCPADSCGIRKGRVGPERHWLENSADRNKRHHNPG